jgi:hypothetical protein
VHILYICTGFDNLLTAVDPISEDFEKYLLDNLIAELKNLFLLNLATDIVCDRFTAEDDFSENFMD